jgi:hypothetical protein
MERVFEVKRDAIGAADDVRDDISEAFAARHGPYDSAPVALAQPVYRFSNAAPISWHAKPAITT